MTDALRLFLPGFLSALALSAACGALGVLVVLRRSVFQALALSQFAACGVATALLLHSRLPGHQDLHGYHAVFHCLADPGLMALAGVLVGMLLSRREGSLPPEARLGGLTALAWAASILIVAGSPYGLDEVKHLLFADLLLVRWDGFTVLGALSASLLGSLALFHRPFLLSAFDPDQALAAGLKPGRWRLALDLLLAATIALGISAAGTLVVFGLLVLPALGILGSAKRMKGTLPASAALGMTGTLTGLWLSLYADVPAGPAVVACVAGLAWLRSRF